MMSFHANRNTSELTNYLSTEIHQRQLKYLRYASWENREHRQPGHIPTANYVGRSLPHTSQSNFFHLFVRHSKMMREFVQHNAAYLLLQLNFVGAVAQF
jgi:hypothetical protein